MAIHSRNEETHNTYPEFNGLHEGMLKHSKAGASGSPSDSASVLVKVMKGAALLPTTIMGGLMAGLVLLAVAAGQLSSLKPKLIERKSSTAQVEVQTSGIASSMAS